jgi:sugar lactone lactonase YvrE
MYFTDSPEKCVVAYDYDSETGAISNKRTFYKIEDEGAVPDGCTIDSEGHLWIALHEGSRVIRVSPEGKLVGQVLLKAWKITCPVFGGPNLDQLFITTAGVGADEPKPEGSRDHGAVFRIKTKVKGLPANKFILQAKP